MRWKQIPNSVYKVSDTGIVIGNHPNYPNHELKHEINIYDGHHRVCLIINGKKIRPQVHRLVAELFVPNPNNFPCVNHIDENPDNNCADNLEWCTAQYNNTYNNIHIRRGELERFPVEVYNNDGLVEICESVTDCCNKYETHHTIYRCFNKDNKSKKGYWYIVKRHNKSRSKSQETIS